MMWFWLPLVWLLVACVVGVWLGGVMRSADRNDALRRAVDLALDEELAAL